jgi:uncharacterized protein YjiS (DUF1127 family)
MSFQSNAQATPNFSNADFWTKSARVLGLIQEWRIRIALRKALGGATDRQLRDAGLIRHDMEDACNLPISHSAASSVTGAAWSRGANW